MIHMYKYFVFILIWVSGWLTVALASEINHTAQINWEPARESFQEESTFLPSLYFQGAIYSDSLPQVPLYSKQFLNQVPHFSYSFSLSDKEVTACSDSESVILEEAGFAAEDFKLVSLSENTRGESWTRLHLVPVRKREGKFEKLVSFTVNAKKEYDSALKYDPVHDYPESSVLSKGNWYKMCVSKEGIYRLDYDDLVDLGLSPGQVQKSTIRIYGNGGGVLPEANDEFRYTDLQQNAIWVSGSSSGTFTDEDYILFYGQSPHRWSYDEDDDIFTHEVHHYSDEACYFLTHGQGEGKRVQPKSQSQQNPTHTINYFYDYTYHQNDIRNLVGSGKIWFGELFDVTLSRDFTFQVPDISTQHEAHIKVYAAARSSMSSSFSIEAFGASSGFSMPGVPSSSVTGFYARHSIGNLRVTPSDEQFNVRLSYNRTASGGRGWLNYIALNFQRHLTHNTHQLFFRNPSVTGVGNIARYEIADVDDNIRIWDVTDPLNAGEQGFDLSSGIAWFAVGAEQLKEFVVFGDEQFPKPSLKGAVPNQNLHAAQVHDLIIVVPDLFREQAERLADFRREHDGLSVKLVSPQEIYNEFSSGVTDISAIRNFMKMFYDRAAHNGNYPRYLLLFGNGTYDNKNNLGYGGNHIPTFQTRASLSPATSYISDDFFGLLDDDEGFDASGAIDMGIGRFPVRTVDEARFVVDKVIRYNERVEGLVQGTDDPRFAGVVSNYANWRNMITLIADDEDGNVHFNQSESLANYMDNHHPVYNIEKIYLDSYEQQTMAGGSRYPDVNNAINNRVNQGALLMNYIGHGGTLGLAHERILTFDDILSWGNFYNLPVFMTATCEFSSFDQPDPNELSAGVRVFLKPDGGASALFTTTRLAYSHSNFTLNDAFMRNAFKPMDNGEMPRLGDLIRIAKVESSSTASLKNFVLLGDPSMQLAYPKYKAVTTEAPDEMKALEEVTIKGEVHKPDGSLASGFNGIIYPTVYDKKTNYTTLGNDPGSYVAEFTMQNRILFRGKASVTDGEFSFSFIVPRDISYNTGTGKISYYFDDGEQYDGHGYYNDFVVSGTSTDYEPDLYGPQITLYLNNENFQPGDNTGPDPVLFAILEDESGINTTGQIGHDIVAFLNDDFSSPHVLNDYYQTDVDSYKSGRVVYPFFNLDKGEHTLTLRAWDVHNNVATESIDFVVTSPPGIELAELVNFPNPFSEQTQFSIVHNKPATELNVKIEIFSLNGQLIKTIQENIYASGFNVPPIEWDGRDSGGTMLNTGVYIYRAMLSTQDGDQVQKTEKLMIVR